MHRSNCHQIVTTTHREDGGRINSNVVSSSSGPLDSLPKQFVNSMKTLFDIMDDKRTGFVKLTDIEKGWQDDGNKGLPYGVIDSLRKVTPTSGMLSFERFCAGLKICLLRNQAERKCRRISAGETDISVSNNNNNNNLSKSSRPPSAPLLDIENPIPNSQWANTNNTATVRPNNATAQSQRALSLPQLSPDSETYSSDALIIPEFYRPPPKPPRSAIITQNNHKSTFNKAEIRNALQSWQMGVLMNEMENKDKRKALVASPLNHLTSRGTADGGSNNATISSQQQSPTQTTAAAITKQQQEFYQKKEGNKRRETRRHTLQNGIDYNLLKRLKQYEAEKDVLLQGLTAVEQAREWYFKQISIVEEKIKYLGHSGIHVEQWTEAHQERLGFQRARVNEINRHLAALQFIWERGGYPSHMNLAVYNRPSVGTTAQYQPPPPPLPPLSRSATNHSLSNYELNQKDNSNMSRDHIPLIRSVPDLMPKSIAVKDTDNIF